MENYFDYEKDYDFQPKEEDRAIEIDLNLQQLNNQINPYDLQSLMNSNYDIPIMDDNVFGTFDDDIEEHNIEIKEPTPPYFRPLEQESMMGANEVIGGATQENEDVLVAIKNTSEEKNILGADEKISEANKNTLGACENVLGANKNTLGACENILGANENVSEVNENMMGANKNTLGACENVLGANKNTLGACENILGANKNTLGACENILGANENVSEVNENMMGANEDFLGEKSGGVGDKGDKSAQAKQKDKKHNTPADNLKFPEEFASNSPGQNESPPNVAQQNLMNSPIDFKELDVVASTENKIFGPQNESMISDILKQDNVPTEENVPIETFENEERDIFDINQIIDDKHIFDFDLSAYITTGANEVTEDDKKFMGGNGAIEKDYVKQKMQKIQKIARQKGWSYAENEFEKLQNYLLYGSWRI